MGQREEGRGKAHRRDGPAPDRGLAVLHGDREGGRSVREGGRERPRAGAHRLRAEREHPPHGDARDRGICLVVQEHGVEGGQGHLVHAERPVERVPAHGLDGAPPAGHEARLGSPEQLVAAEGHEVGPRAQAPLDGRLGVRGLRQGAEEAASLVLHQLAPAHQNLPPFGQGVEGQQDRGRAVVDDHGALRPEQLAEPVLGMRLAITPGSRREVVLEVRVGGGDLGYPRGRDRREGSPAQVGVDHHPGGVQHADERGPARPFHPVGEVAPQAIQRFLEAGLVSRGRAVPGGIEEAAQDTEHHPAPVSLHEAGGPRILQHLVHRGKAAPQVGARRSGHERSLHLARSLLLTGTEASSGPPGRVSGLPSSGQANGKRRSRMRRNRSRWAFLASLTLALGLWGSVPAWAYHRASLEVDIGLFYKDLAPYGDWVEVRDGWAWAPRVHHGWRPYAYGRWVWTDDHGWLWLSDEDFGWAVFHYGRWYRDPVHEWVWVPGYEWGPGWVAWRSGGGYVGWAPLPPRVAWSARVGFRVGAAEIDALIEPRDYTFCEERIFVEPGVHRHLFPIDRNPGLIRVTRNVTDYRVVESRVVDRSLDVERVERSIGRRVPRQRVVEVDSVGAARRGLVKGDAGAVFQPRVLPRADAVPPRGKALRRSAPEVREKDQRREAREAERRLARERGRQEQEDRRIHKRRQAEDREAQRRPVREREHQERARQDLERRQAHERQTERRQLRENRQQERARQDLERRQARERQAMEHQHRREIKKPRGEADLDQRLAREHREMTERQQRERQQQDAARTQARRERQEAAAAQRRGAENQGDHRAKTPDKRREAREKPKDRPK